MMKHFLLSVLLLQHLFAIDGTQVSTSTSTYRLFEEQLSWTDANISCYNKGGQLAVFETLGELSTVFLSIENSLSTEEVYWIGAEKLSNDTAGLTNFNWINGAKFNFTVQGKFPWRFDEPNNGPPPAAPEKCVEVIFKKDATPVWNDKDCAESRRYICEFPFVQYKLFQGSPTELLNWTDANLSCAKEGGYLAVITSIEEHNLVNAFLRDNLDSALDVWIGGEKLSIGIPELTEFNWVNGEDFTFTNIGEIPWEVDEPNNFNPNFENELEECIEIAMSRPAGRWNDIHCSFPRAYLCEFDFPKALTSEKKYIATSEYKLYQTIAETKSWMDANLSCTNEGGQLAVIESLEEFEAVNDFLINNFVQPDCCDVWVGAEKFSIKNPGLSEFSWVNGAEFNFQSNIFEFPWKLGEPNNHNHGQPGAIFEECLVINKESRLDDRQCIERSAYLCEFKIIDDQEPRDEEDQLYVIAISIISIAVIILALLLGAIGRRRLMKQRRMRINEERSIIDEAVQNLENPNISSNDNIEEILPPKTEKEENHARKEVESNRKNNISMSWFSVMYPSIPILSKRWFSTQFPGHNISVNFEDSNAQTKNEELLSSCDETL